MSKASFSLSVPVRPLNLTSARDDHGAWVEEIPNSRLAATERSFHFVTAGDLPAWQQDGRRHPKRGYEDWPAMSSRQFSLFLKNPDKI